MNTTPDVKSPRSDKRSGRPPKFTDAALLSAALRFFAAYGYEGMSVRDLNRALGISHNTIHQRFGSKERLWYAAVDHGFAQLMHELPRPAPAAPGEPTPPLEVLGETIRVFLRASRRQPEILRLMNHVGVHDSPRMTYIFDTYVAVIIEPLDALLKQLHAEGACRRIPIRSLHFLITHGAAAPFTLTGLSKSFDAIGGPLDEEEHIDAVVDTLIAGLRLDRSAEPS